MPVETSLGDAQPPRQGVLDRLAAAGGQQRQGHHTVPYGAKVERFLHRVKRLRFLRGHRLLWGKLRTVREVRFHAFDPVRIAPLGDPWPPGCPAA